MIEISDTSFDLLKSSNYTLSIRLIPSGFCFAVSDKEMNLLYFASCEDSFPADNEVVTKPFGQVYLCVDSNTYTLIPNPVYQPELQEQYWNLNFGSLSPMEKLQADNVRLTDIVNLFSYPVYDQRLMELKKKFPFARLIHRQSVQLCLATMRNKQTNNKQLFIHILNASFDVICMEKGSVILANTYDYHNEDEFLYFVLNIFEQLKLDSHTMEVVVGGSPAGREKELLLKYLRNVQEDPQPIMKPLSEPFLKHSDILNKQYTLINIPFAIN
ncbi:MAG: DUF3822 family protein [Paludibacteraceae bacterium]|nr:DUF3822 family protein [Paludibacteraceae bacterium]